MEVDEEHKDPVLQKCIVESEKRIKDLKMKLMFNLQMLIVFKPRDIKEKDWKKIYEILDLTILDEIFQELDSLSKCCNLDCDTTLTRDPRMRYGKLIDHYIEEDKGKPKPQSLGTIDVVAYKQELFYCSEYCYDKSKQIVRKIMHGNDTFLYKSMKYFKFLSNYQKTQKSLEELCKEVEAFKSIVQIKRKSTPKRPKVQEKKFTSEEKKEDLDAKENVDFKVNNSSIIPNKNFYKPAPKFCLGEQDIFSSKKVDNKHLNNDSSTKSSKTVRFDLPSDQTSTNNSDSDSSDNDNTFNLQELHDSLFKSSSCKLNMFLISICDKNRLCDFLNYTQKPTIQATNSEKLDQFSILLYNHINQSDLSKNTKKVLIGEIGRLILHLTLDQVDQVPEFNKNETRSLVYCILKFMYDNCTDGVLIEEVKKYIEQIDQEEYNSNLMANFSINSE